MRVLVAYESKLGGTAGIAGLIGDTLADAGLPVKLLALDRRAPDGQR